MSTEKHVQTRGCGLLVGGSILVAITVVVVCMRLWARLVILRRGGSDDFLIVIATLCGLGYFAVALLATIVYGQDRHIWDVSKDSIVPSYICAWVAQIMYSIGSGCTKMAIVIFYRRVLSAVAGILFRRLTFVLMIVVFAYAVTQLVMLIFVCQPVEAFWLHFSESYNGKWYCHNMHIPFLAMAILNVFLDLILAILPACFIHRLQIPRKQKIALNCIFGLGLLACVAGVLRTVYAVTAYTGIQDSTWYAYDVWLWILVESNVAIICGSATALNVFFHRYLGGSSTTDGHSARGAATMERSFKCARAEEMSKWDPERSPQLSPSIYTVQSKTMEDIDTTSKYSADGLDLEDGINGEEAGIKRTSFPPQKVVLTENGPVTLRKEKIHLEAVAEEESSIREQIVVIERVADETMYPNGRYPERI